MASIAPTVPGGDIFIVYIVDRFGCVIFSIFILRIFVRTSSGGDG
jgi:hypothetical protein